MKIINQNNVNKFRFISLYAVSVILIAILFTSLKFKEPTLYLKKERSTKDKISEKQSQQQQERILSLENKVKNKDQRIAALEQQLQTRPIATVALPSKEDNELRKTNEKLKSQIASLENKNASLTNANIGLKRNNQILNLEIVSSRDRSKGN